MGNINLDWLKTNVQWVKAGQSRGYSVTKIWRTIFKERPGIRKTDFYATLRHYNHEDSRARDAWKSTPRKYKPAESQLGKAPFQLHKNFLVEYDVFGHDSVTGEKTSFTGRIGYDELESRGRIEDTIREISESEEAMNYWDWLENTLTVEEIKNVRVYYR